MKHVHKWQMIIASTKSQGHIEIETCVVGNLCLAVRITQEYDYQLEKPIDMSYKPQKRQVKVIPCMTEPWIKKLN